MKKIVLCFMFVINSTFVLGQNITHNGDAISDQSDELITIAKKHLNSLQTLNADFVQIDQLGTKTSGHIWLDRKKKKLKLESDQHRIIVKDNKMDDFDKELKERTVSSIYSSPLAFLLDEKIDFKKIIVLHAIGDQNSFSIRLTRNDNDIEGQVELHFENNLLIGWTFFYNDDDFTGVTIELHNIKRNKTIDEDVFM